LLTILAICNFVHLSLRYILIWLCAGMKQSYIFCKFCVRSRGALG